ncbi:ParA family protein [Rhizobium paknamense]|uniref:Chromosome partitioning protein n=1 Tax=Rhizobium paknamense TaxID=1206817 RepID=A0ABU0I9A8_9HYPH|nr:ParA family protein [Rhizobium paknamense]MDQ0453804.1 chromosome partitioning protein [Rhizobium paknamense]
MPLITFANTKGGAGKTTAVLLVASDLVRRGQRVTIVDADPRRWISRWLDISEEIKGLSVLPACEDDIEDVVAKAKKKGGQVLIDLPSSHDALLAKAVGLADHVLIPVQGCAMDAAGAAEVLDLLKELDLRCQVKIPHSVVLTRVNAAVTTRALHAAREFLGELRIPVLATAITERAAYRDIFDKGGLLHGLKESEVSNVKKAIENAERLTDEILALVPQKAVRTPSVKKAAAVKKAA